MVKNLPANAGNTGSIPELGRTPGEGNGNPLQYSCLGNPMDKGAWWATVHGVCRVRHDLGTKKALTLRVNPLTLKQQQQLQDRDVNEEINP